MKILWMASTLFAVALAVISNPADAVVGLLKCKTGTPLPTECKCTIGTAATVSNPPLTLATASGGVPAGTYCWCDFKTLTTGTVNWRLVPSNPFGDGPASALTTDLGQFGVPAQLEATPIMLPALPQ